RPLPRTCEADTLVDCDAPEQEQGNDTGEYRQHADDERTESDPLRPACQPLVNRVADDGEDGRPGNDAGKRPQDRHAEIEDCARAAGKGHPPERGIAVRPSVRRVMDGQHSTTVYGVTGWSAPDRARRAQSVRPSTR